MFGWFKKLGSWLSKAVKFVEEKVSDENISMAVAWVKVAREKFVDQSERREFVVKLLKAKGVPENLARLAVEIAVGLVKAEDKPEA
jgi:pimeloyl-CoA synthetase